MPLLNHRWSILALLIVTAVACLPLLRGEGKASLRALELATGSDDDGVFECASWSLSVRDPKRARPEIDEEEED